jgi:hypothetical protein
VITYKHIGYRGRIGNQMFHLSTLISIGKKLGYEIGIPIKSGIIEDIELPDVYNTEGPNKNQVFNKLRDGFDLNLNKFAYDLNTQYDFIESSFNYDPSILNIKDNTNLNGHFQSEKYFIEHRDEIRKTFSFKPSIKNTVGNFLDVNNITGFVTAHVRRGDYVGNNGIYNLEPEYYHNILKEFKNKQIVFVSDDLDYCKLHFPNHYYYNTVSTPFEDMYLMTLSNVNLIANSTFSWWGAWLNRNTVVISPNPHTKWFKTKITNKYQSGIFNTSDLIPPHWISI